MTILFFRVVRLVAIVLLILAIISSGATSRKATAQDRNALPDNSRPAQPAGSIGIEPKNSVVVREAAFHPISVAGLALDPAGNPIAGARIYLSSQEVNWRRLAETVSDAKGHYSFQDIPLPIETDSSFANRSHGKFEVFGIADGYGFGWRPTKWYFPERDPDARKREHEDVDPPARFYEDDLIELDILFRAETKFSGRLVDETGQPIADARVDIRNCDSDIDIASWRTVNFETQFASLNSQEIVPTAIKARHTDVDGRFSFNGLPADCRLRIDVRPPGFPLRSIWGVTKSGFPNQVDGQRVYHDGMVLEFARARDVLFRVVYDDTGEPVAKARVGVASSQGHSSGVSDTDGHVTLRLSAGEQTIELLPAIGTPYLVTNLTQILSTQEQQQPIVLRLRPAAVVEVQVVDETTGMGVPGVDFWSIDLTADSDNRSRSLHYFRSYEAETRICHVERPRTDSDGKLRALFEPGRYQVGIGLTRFPNETYINVDGGGSLVELGQGESTSLRFAVKAK